MFGVTYNYSSMSVKLNSPHSLSLGAHYWMSLGVILGILGSHQRTGNASDRAGGRGIKPGRLSRCGLQDTLLVREIRG